MDPNQLEPIVESILIVLIEALRERLTRQGHRLSGRLIKSMRFKVDVKGEKIVGDILMEHYAGFLDSGVSASRIPFSGISPGAGPNVSQYIQGLISFWRQRGLPEREATSAAFATAKVHAREGMPTRASRRFSSDDGGARTGFIGRTTEERQPYILSLLANKAGTQLTVSIEQAFKREITGVLSL